MRSPIAYRHCVFSEAREFVTLRGVQVIAFPHLGEKSVGDVYSPPRPPSLAEAHTMLLGPAKMSAACVLGQYLGVYFECFVFG